MTDVIRSMEYLALLFSFFFLIFESIIRVITLALREYSFMHSLGFVGR